MAEEDGKELQDQEEKEDREFSDSEIKTLWQQFFLKYSWQPKIKEVMDGFPNECALMINYWDLDKFNDKFSQTIIDDPRRAVKIGEDVIAADYTSDKPDIQLRIRIHSLPSDRRYLIRKLRAEHLGSLISINGTVTRVTEVRPKLIEGFFECLRCHAIMRVEEGEFDFIEPLECSKDDSKVYVGEPGCGSASTRTSFKFLEKRSTFQNTQRIEVKESPEDLTGREQPESLTIYATDDLVGMINPGDRVVFNATLRSKQKGRDQRKTTFFEIYLEAHSFEMLQVAYQEIKIPKEKLEQIEALAADPQIYLKLRGSISPTIYGMNQEKDALALQLFGGVTKHMPDLTTIRGDIHILKVGDPGTGKSQLLDYISKIAPRGMKASGKASTAAGLTAAARQDTSPFGQGRWVFEAGALVLSDLGQCCIDEIDKMSAEDRSSMHEAMEQQRISFAKAGMNVTMLTRCSILAAANPKWGRFELSDFRSIVKQIDLPPTLLSRFDVIFPIFDEVNQEQDGAKADHILKTHQAGGMISHNKNVNEDFSLEEIEVALTDHAPEIEPELLKMYIAHAKRTCFPVLSKEAMTELKKFWLGMRTQASMEEDGDGPPPITARYLEALVRMSEAAARVQLKSVVDQSHAKRAIALIGEYLNRVAKDGDFIDTDILETGYSRKERDDSKTIIRIIQDLINRAGRAQHQDVLDEAWAFGVHPDRAKTLIEDMLDAGMIFDSNGKKEYTVKN